MKQLKYNNVRKLFALLVSLEPVSFTRNHMSLHAIWIDHQFLPSHLRIKQEVEHKIDGKFRIRNR